MLFLSIKQQLLFSYAINPVRLRYLNVMQWTDRIRQVKILLVVAAIIIAVASLVVSHFLTKDLEAEERNKMEVWAEAMRSLNKADDNTDLSLVLKVLNENNTIPVIVMDSNGNVSEFRNLKISADNYDDSLRVASDIGRRLKASGRDIRINLNTDDPSVKDDYIDVVYDDSLMLKRLAIYPFVQLGVVMLFVVIAIFALLTSKRAEQNKVWVGLSKGNSPSVGNPDIIPYGMDRDP